MSDNITINQATGDIKTNGEYLLQELGLVKSNASGSVAIYGAGEYGGATVTLGYIAGTTFYPHDLPAGGPADYTDTFQVVADAGKNPRLAVKVAAISGTTNIMLITTPVR